jgi:hypothetical protein
MESEAFGEVVDYHHPALGADWKELALKEVYRALGERFGATGSANGLLVVKDLQGRFVPVSTEEELVSALVALDRWQPAIEGFETNQICESRQRWKVSSRKSELFPVNYELNERFEKKVPLTPDFEQEVRDLVERLLESGSVRLIGEVLEQLQQATTKVSRLFITDDCRIFLKDFGMKEVQMQPLAKCLFLLYLKHEKGIRFKELSDYEDELLSIYRTISLREKPDDVVESIRAMTNPLSNSVNEKCSRIRAAFLMVIAEELAGEYLITGKKGEVKRIRLDRSLVEYQ